MNIKKGDTVKVIQGRDRGKTGNVLRIIPLERKAIIEGVFLVKKRSRPSQQGKKGETVMVPRPLSLSSVMIVCPHCKRAVRMGARIEDGHKARVCKKCGGDLK